MTAESLGAFSTSYSRHIFPEKNEVVWVRRTYNPIEPRRTTPVPVPRHKFIYPQPEKLPDVPDEWRRHVIPPIYSYSRQDEEKSGFTPSPATRCEAWSTLRQILPSRGIVEKRIPPRWGTGHAQPQNFIDPKMNRYPHFNSPMTRYVSSHIFSSRLHHSLLDLLTASPSLTSLKWILGLRQSIWIGHKGKRGTWAHLSDTYILKINLC